MPGANNSKDDSVPQKAYFVQALQEAQAEINQLRDERDSLETECLALHAQNGILNNEIAHLKSKLASLKQQ